MPHLVVRIGLKYTWIFNSSLNLCRKLTKASLAGSQENIWQFMRQN
jgi:hypothetical protein